MIAPTLYILRHGETEWNAEGRLQGHFDSALTQAGQEQAQAQREILRSCDLTNATAYCSPQGRALATARLAFDGLIDGIQTDDRLKEIGLGDWAGRHRSALLSDLGLSDGFDLYERAPGGEGFARLHSRCVAFLATLEGPAVIVTHGITSRMLRLILTGRPIGDLPDLEGGQGVVFRLENGKQTRLVKRA